MRGVRVMRAAGIHTRAQGSEAVRSRTNETVDCCPELDCLRAWLPADVLETAAARAARLGLGADRVLIAAGKLSEEDYVRALAAQLDVPFETFDGRLRASYLLADQELAQTARHGLLPIEDNELVHLVVAPRGTAARRLSALIMHARQGLPRMRFTTSARLTSFLLRCGCTALAESATHGLEQKWAWLSAGPSQWRADLRRLIAIALLAAAVFGVAPNLVTFSFEVLLATLFFAWLVLRLTGAFVQIPPEERPAADAPDRELPAYTIIAALYREARSVDGLLRAIEHLDYPREKLDVLIVVEADDRETRAALADRRTSLPLTVIPVPTIGPRTKPKALNFALPFARGDLTVIYDAEDRPQPDQLRCAIRAFRRGGDDLACVQAKLCVDNGADGWLAQLFTAEYASQFDVFLPGVAALRLPLPLGGSSNHFYTSILREVGGWDPYNVTEDADLGMRLARFGYRTGVIDSTTYEEAPARFGPWLRQRTRWFKGWMQCWLVHMRRPFRLARELGAAGFLGFQLIVGGNVLAALAHPLFIAQLIYTAASGTPPWPGDDPLAATIAMFFGATAVAGYATSAFLGWLGLFRRGLLAHAWILLLTPAHWLLLSLAAWRAVYQLLISPYLWEKTEHGLAKSSLRATGITRSLVELERHLTALKAKGELNVLAADAGHHGTRRPHASDRR